MPARTPELASFSRRLAAHLLDLVWMLPLSIVLGLVGDAVQGGAMTLGGEIMASIVIGLVVVSFWAERQGTPGKLMLGLRIVDADGGPLPSLKRLLWRYAGYVVSAMPICLGYLWMLWDRRGQTWHDKMARTVVIKLPE